MAKTERVELAGDRFTDEERELVKQGMCSHQTAYGLPWTEYCRKPLTEPGQVECTEHEADAQEAGQSILRLAN